MSDIFNYHRFFNKFPVIELGTIKLRDLMLSDKERYFKMMSEPEVIKYLSDEDVPNSLEQTEQEIKFWGGLFYRKQSVFWTISDTSTDEFLGTIGFNTWNFSNRRAEISYDLMKEYWNRGIMTKALTNAIIFGFKNMNLHRIEARTMLGNIPSQRLLEKVGFKREGTMRGYRIIRGEPIDVYIYSITANDFAGFLA
ncbi:GNAT family N-acetyltransferase [Candidatus Jidaibacter acanthamoebae]|uniref:GNAT family N-acetyltransferase n=1 Tax=Candidatus Jidaibacter acanthamoebae TaxID=86105 RepID=UPI00057FDAB6|nr:GNAT family protein [Candidatus Jidaibacter acanthamoeba]